MQAHNFTPLYDLITKLETNPPEPRRWYESRISGCKESMARAQAGTEHDWMVAGRPYYTVFPIAQEALRRVRLDLPSNLVQLPLDTLLIRFGIGHEPDCAGLKLRTILAGRMLVRETEPGIGLWCDFGERMQTPAGEIPVYNYLCVSLSGERPLEEVFSDPDFVTADATDTKAEREALRFVVAISLLGPDSELVDPDVLSKDRASWKETGDQKIVDRAIRRGKLGWLIGSELGLEASPHVRRPHFGLRWTGEDRRIPRIVPISGCVVRGRVLTEVPTGYQDRD